MLGVVWKLSSREDDSGEYMDKLYGIVSDRGL